MNPQLFHKFSELVNTLTGIHLAPGKESMVSARIQRRMRVLNISSASDYYEYVVNPEHKDEIIHLIDAISTNVTYFYREHIHFDFLTGYVKECVEAGQTQFKVWCAAASSGEEPYTIAMTIQEAAFPNRFEWKMLATDISTRVLATAKQAKYSEEKLSKVPDRYRHKYFHRVQQTHEQDAAGKIYVVSDELRTPIRFARLNLTDTPYPMRGPFDCVFCRNVMIYFENELRARLLQEVYRLLRPGGILILGSAESLVGLTSDLQAVKPSIYRKPLR
ncbi:MAG: methyltransferase domain-containing protein [bacterium]|nr:methyltransferase domain-containing protein [bacterium]